MTASANETKILRKYGTMDGIPSCWEIVVACAPDEFDRLRDEFRPSVETEEQARALPRLDASRDGNLGVAVCYNPRWAAFLYHLIHDRKIGVTVAEHCTTGNARGQWGMDRNDGMTRDDVRTEGMIELREGAGAYHVVVEDSAVSMTFHGI